MELGHLTRDLLTEVQLWDILTQAMRSHQVIEQLSWYYQNLPVSSLRRSQGKLLYRVELPLLASRPSLLYHLTTLPTPLLNSSQTVTLQVAPRIALDTVLGNLATPQRCRGHAPAVCVLGAQYGPSRMQCARGLITNRRMLIKHCKVKFSDLGMDPLVTSLDVNQYAITTLGLTLTVRCAGAPELHMVLSRGTHNVTCLKPCTLASPGFSITCVDYLHLTRRYVMPTATITSFFNFSTAVALSNVTSILPKTRNIHMSPLADLDLPVMHHPVFSTALAHPNPRKYPSVWTIIALVLLTLTYSFLILVYCRWRCIHFRRQRVPTVPPTSDATAIEVPVPLPLGPPPTQTDSATHNFAFVPRIWPTLPDIDEDISTPQNPRKSTPLPTPPSTPRPNLGNPPSAWPWHLTPLSFYIHSDLSSPPPSSRRA